MDKPNLFVQAKTLRKVIARLRVDAHDLAEFDRELEKLHREYADVFASKTNALGLRHDISDARVQLKIAEFDEAIDATSVELDCSDLRLWLAISNAYLQSPIGSGFLLKAFESLKVSLERWMDETKTTDLAGKASRITVSGLDALELRDTLESALVDDSALRVYGNQLMREGDTGRGGYAVGTLSFQRVLNSFRPPHVRPLLTPDARRFRAKLSEVLATASNLEFVAVEINAGKLHLLVSGISTLERRIPMCCKSMLMAMLPGDKVVSQAHTEDSALLTIRYSLPRQ